MLTEAREEKAPVGHRCANSSALQVVRSEYRDCHSEREIHETGRGKVQVGSDFLAQRYAPQCENGFKITAQPTDGLPPLFEVR